MFEIIDPKP